MQGKIKVENGYEEKVEITLGIRKQRIERILVFDKGKTNKQKEEMEKE